WERIAESVGDGMKPKTGGVGGECSACQPRPLDRALALLDPLLACSAFIVEGNDIFGGPRHVRHDEADTRIKFSGMPFDLGDDSARLCPASGLIGEICIRPPHFVRRPPDRAWKKMAHPLLHNAVCRQPDRVFDPLGFEKLVNVWIGEGGVSPEIDARDLPFVAFDDWLEHALPAVGAVVVAGTQHAAFQIAELVEQEQWMVKGAAIVAVPEAHLLLAMGGTGARIHVEHDAARRTAIMDLIDPLSRKIGKGGKVLFGGEPSRLEAAHLARRGRAPKSYLATNNPAHCRIMTQTLGVVHIFVS